MAIQISGTTVIDNSKRLAQRIVKYSTTASSNVGFLNTIYNGLYIATADGAIALLPRINIDDPPVVGYQITFCAAYTPIVNGFTIQSNGNLVMGSAQDIVIDVENAFVVFTYVGGTIGWQVSM